MESILLLIMIAIASAAISFTITTTSIFEWLRELVSPLHYKLEELIHCPWCLGHYICLIFLLFINKATVFFNINIMVHYILNWFFVVGVMGICHFVLLKAYQPIAKMMAERMIKKMQNE